MAEQQVCARAKLNLSLDVLGRRNDGYHDLRMVMQTVELVDRLTIQIGTEKPVQMSSNMGFLPCNEKNLAVAAALRLAEQTGADYKGLSIRLDKSIPVCAGMAGGSADAAAVLRGLNGMMGLNLSREQLEKVGELVGSDVPYCVRGGTVLAEGRGEILTDLPQLPPCYAVVCKPGFSTSTPELFAKIDSVKLRCRPDTAGLISALETGDLGGAARRMYNVFEDALSPRRAAETNSIKSMLISHGALGASMSGTGPSVFGLFDDEKCARSACEELRGIYREVFLAHTAVADMPGDPV